MPNLIVSLSGRRLTFANKLRQLYTGIMIQVFEICILSLVHRDQLGSPPTPFLLVRRERLPSAGCLSTQQRLVSCFQMISVEGADAVECCKCAGHLILPRLSSSKPRIRARNVSVCSVAKSTCRQTDSSQQSSAHPASVSTNSFAFGCSQVVDVEDLRSFADVSIR